MTIGSLMKGGSIAECWSISQYFWPALSDNKSWKPIFVLFGIGRYTQVLLYFFKCHVIWPIGPRLEDLYINHVWSKLNACSIINVFIKLSCFSGQTNSSHTLVMNSLSYHISVDKLMFIIHLSWNEAFIFTSHIGITDINIQFFFLDMPAPCLIRF